ncbi:MAG: MarR family winged helix-turn-helix transcriptional regulator [Longimicrobiales bacterium]
MGRNGEIGPAERAELAARLHAAAIHLLRRVRKEDVASGLTPARLSALSVLVFGGARTIGELAAVEQVAPPTMTRLLSALEADGYVTRRTDEADRRVVIVEATARAHEALEAGRRRRVGVLLELLEDWSPTEWRALSRTLAAVERALRA